MEILSVDSQESYNDGVMVVVTGILIGSNLKRKFMQAFFLAPQDNGYFVLNDVFRYLDDKSVGSLSAPTKDADETPTAARTNEPGNSYAGFTSVYLFPSLVCFLKLQT